MAKPKTAPAVVRSWKRLLAVGCSHGCYADEIAIAAVLKFRDAFKPEHTIHLGDFIDATAFRSGARGTNDESSPVAPDLDSGLDFLDQLRPSLVLCGNHEARLWHLTNHPNAIVAECAIDIVRRIESRIRKLRADLVEYHGVWAGRRIGGHFFTHGSIHSENATRDMAEMHGKVVHAHTHRCAVAKGRRDDNPTGYCVGTLTAASNMDYAATRRATLAWSQGFVWGEVCGNEAVLWLHEQPRGTEWRLPA
jgi:hypothetical protein